MSTERIVYPFTAIVGQEDMKKALLLNLINPSLGGVLIRGEKGTAKSTAVRALGALLEEVRVVELPISATEDRVVGSLNIEEAVKNGEKVFEPGILVQANGNILYVDEINLLDDHIVDILLDSAAMGVNTVEREGISYSHAAKFVLVGTMNPEEGDLRPQLLDRFGLVVEIKGEEDIEKRSELIRRRLSFEQDPQEFIREYKEEENTLKCKIKEAKELLPKIIIEEKCYRDAAKIGAALHVDGHRADITLLKTALTLAAFYGEEKISRKHILEAAKMVLPHRMRRMPFDTSNGLPTDWEEILNA